MKTISVRTGRPYDIHIGTGILPRCGNRIAAISNQRYQKVAIITDDTVGPLYGKATADSITGAGFEVHTYTIPQGEASKSFDKATEILAFLSEHFFTRFDLIVALGGGVVGDLAGFAASIYQRGVDYVQIPTTLLAAIDSSVGGKTAVNIPAGKNLVGTFWQPRLVICDVSTLDTLPEDIFNDGVAEAIKYSCIHDEALFNRIAKGGIKSQIIDIVAICVGIKKDIVAEDEREYGVRRLLNFGHTVGHAVENLSDYAVSHGKGVAVGMVYAAMAGERAGITQTGTAHRIRNVLATYGLPQECGYSTPQLAKVCLHDKKRCGCEMSLILLESVGKPTIHKVPAEDLMEFLQG